MVGFEPFLCASSDNYDIHDQFAVKYKVFEYASNVLYSSSSSFLILCCQSLVVCLFAVWFYFISFGLSLDLIFILFFIGK